MYRKRYYMVVVLFVLYIISSVVYLNSGIGLSYDEPHYIVNALALIHGDFNVKDIYLNHEYASFYNGTLDPHVSLNSTNGKWYSIHGYGLSILIVPFVIVGKILHNIPFAIHLFNIIVYVIAFFLFLKIIELRSDNREKTNFLLLLFLFITLPIIIFTNFLGAIEGIGNDLNQHSIEYLTITGATSNREKIVKEFQENDEIKVMLMTLKTGGLGLNLTASDIVFIFDPWWNVAAETQAIDRTHRIGQNKVVFSYKLVAKDSIEEKILKLQEQKKELVDDIITSDLSTLKKITEKDIEILFA
jgi:SNF2 family DNA or RNA helicase